VHRPYSLYPQLSRGSRGDLVVWAQEHLRGAGYPVRVTGIYRHSTVRAVKRFQTDNALPVVGQIGSATWPKLLRGDPKMVDWSSKGSPRSAKRSSGAEPRSASLPAVRYEIPPPRER
jgi:peptidoglycan hydrolase-like protein with peptidoglycan-binding domain